MLQLSQIKSVLEHISIDGQLPKEMLHQYYDESKTIRDDIAKAFGDDYPDYLEKDRPREKEEHRNYRKAIYRNPLKGFLDKQIGRLDYIPESDDFSVVWGTGAQAQKLAAYDAGAFNEKAGWVDWFFDFVKTDFVKDPNSVLVFVPETIPGSDSEPYRPIAELIPCENVLQFRKGKFACLRSSKEVLVRVSDSGKTEKNGLLLYFFDHESFTVVRELTRDSSKNLKKSTFQVWGLSYAFSADTEAVQAVFRPFLHHGKSMPARKIGLKRLKQNAKGEELFVSTVTNALEHIKDAQARYSDIQVEFNYHVNSQEYRIATRPCSAPGCNKGKQLIRNKGGDIVREESCASCHGTGMEIGGSALGLIVYSMPKKEGFTDVPGGVPPVPGGFIPRPIESVREMIAEYKRKTEEAYADVHMQFHSRVPLVESGVAKETDREEFYKDSIVLAKHLCGLVQWGFNTEAAYLYGVMGFDQTQLPAVMTPTRFMLSGLEETRAELNEAITNGYDAELVAIIQARLLEYQAGKGSKDYKRFATRMLLDPYRDLKPTEKVLQMGVASQVATVGSEAHRALVSQFVFSLQIISLLDEAELKHPDFYQKTIQERRDILWELNGKYTADIPGGMVIPMNFGPDPNSNQYVA